MQPRVYIVVLNYKNWQDVTHCLESIFTLDYQNYSVFVVDNDSRNGSLDHLQDWIEQHSSKIPVDYKRFERVVFVDGFRLSTIPKVTFIQNNENQGFAAGNNLVIDKLKDEDAYLWLLNPDMVVEPGTLRRLVDFAEDHPHQSVIGATIKYQLDSNRVLLYGGARINFNSATVDLIDDTNDIPEMDFVCGGSLFTHARNFQELGLLPEDYFLYWEETDWCYRAKKRGYQMLVCTSAICYDKVSTTIGKGFLADYYYTRNGLLFVSRYRAEKVPIVLFSAFLRLFKRLLSGNWERSKGVYSGILTFLKRKKNAI
jgi:GT2 family glycosyltransferase